MKKIQKLSFADIVKCKNFFSKLLQNLYLIYFFLSILAPPKQSLPFNQKDFPVLQSISRVQTRSMTLKSSQTAVASTSTPQVKPILKKSVTIASTSDRILRSNAKKQQVNFFRILLHIMKILKLMIFLDCK